MCHSRALNNKINRLHERCLRIIYNDKTSTFKDLLGKGDSVPIRYRNIQALAIEMYKVANGISPEIMNKTFQLRGKSHYMSSEIMNKIFQPREKSHYNLRSTSEFIIPSIHSVHRRTVSGSYLRPKTLELIPSVILQIDTFSGSKKAIKNGNLLTSHAGFTKHLYLA